MVNRSINTVIENLTQINSRVDSDENNNSVVVNSSPTPLSTSENDDQLLINSELINSAPNLMNDIGGEDGAELLATNSTSAVVPQPTPSTSTATDSVYRGLYPINQVKKYFVKVVENNQKLYKCIWDGCNFQTRKYSQHISRHIYLKHIGIKELRCKVANCGKEFKRPESLVQHEKNHICGFGIDSNKMKDPDNICGVKNIKKYFTRILDTDIYVYQCQFPNCKFVTNNSGSIRRHIHNQHICPHSSHSMSANNARSNRLNANQTNGNMNTYTPVSTANMSFEGIPSTSTYSPFEYKDYKDDSMEMSGVDSQMDNESNNIEVEVQISEYDDQRYDPIKGTTYTVTKFDNECSSEPFDYSIKANEEGSSGLNEDEEEDGMDVDDELDDDDNDEDDDDDSSAQKPKNGLYSLKNFKNDYRKEKRDNGVVFVCNQCDFEAKSQITLIRHLWGEKGYKEFDCDICSKVFPNEFSLYKHRKFGHRQTSTNSPPPPPPPSSLPHQPQQTDSHFQLQQSTHHQMIHQATNHIEPPSAPQTSRINFDSNSMMDGNDNCDINPNILEMMKNKISLEFLQKFLEQNQLCQQMSIMDANIVAGGSGEMLTGNNLLQFLNANQQNYNIFGMRRYSNESNEMSNHSQSSNKSTGFQCKLCVGFVSDTKEGIIEHLHNTHQHNNTNNLEQAYHLVETVNDKSYSMISLEQANKTNYDTDNFDTNETVEMSQQRNLSLDMSQLNQPSTSKSLSASRTRAQDSVRRYNSRAKSGLYSLKKYQDFYRRTKESDGYHYKCIKCNDYDTKSQASMVRHIWTHEKQEFKCECGIVLENEFALYKHKKKQHPESTSQHNRSKSTHSKMENKIPTNVMPVDNDVMINSFLSNNFAAAIQSNFEQIQQQQTSQQSQTHPPLQPTPYQNPQESITNYQYPIQQPSTSQLPNETRTEPVKKESRSRRSLQFKSYKYQTNEQFSNESDSECSEQSLIVDEQNPPAQPPPTPPRPSSTDSNVE